MVAILKNNVNNYIQLKYSIIITSKKNGIDFEKVINKVIFLVISGNVNLK